MKRYITLMMTYASLAGCAATAPDATSSLMTPAAAASASKSGYVLSADEQTWDCKHLTGRMQVRILEVRGGTDGIHTSSASRLIRSAVAGTVGGSTAGGDPERQSTADRAMLEAYNQQLIAKGCKSYNLDEELKPKDVRISPTANVPAPGAAKSARPPANKP